MKYLVEEIFSKATYDHFGNIFKLSNINFENYNLTEFDILVPPRQACCLFLSYRTIINVIKFGNIEQWLEKFFNNNSYLILNQPIDPVFGVFDLLLKGPIDVFKKYKDRILFYYTGTLDPEITLYLKDFNITQRQESEFFVYCPNFYKNKKIEDLNYKRLNKFLLTTIIKKRRPHRDILAQKLKNLNLLEYHIGKIHNILNTDEQNQHKEYENLRKDYAGNIFADHDWKDGVVSWDLYKQASFEIVPETTEKNVFFITEKTLKPVVAKIPFLILGNVYFYDNLKRLGFKTFDSLIDESFAYETDLNLRTEKLVNTVKDIIDNDALKFYEAAKEICEYNFENYLHMNYKDQYTSYMSLYNFKQHLGIDT